MKKAALIILSLFSTLSWGQNLVKNGSIENTGDCPISGTTLNSIAYPWFSNFGTPDYYHQSCGFPGSASTTNNSLPFDGEAFVGILVYGDTLHEYIHGKLKQPLDSGKFYRVTFYVKPVNDDADGISYGINNIGMLLSDTIIDTIPKKDYIYHAKPQVVAKDAIVTESYWTGICGIFQAKGGEQFITIGNFNTDLNTRAVPLSGAFNPRKAYYLVDYVEVVENDLPQLPKDTIICVDQRIDLSIKAPDVSVTWSDGSTGKNFLITEPGVYSVKISDPGCSYIDTIVVSAANCDECKMYIPNAFTPNGDNKNELFRVQASCAEELVSFHMNIFDRWGRKVFESDDIRVAWDGKNADYQGVYTYTIEYEYPLFRKTQTLTRRGTVTILK